MMNRDIIAMANVLWRNTVNCYLQDYLRTLIDYLRHDAVCDWALYFCLKQVQRLQMDLSRWQLADINTGSVTLKSKNHTFIFHHTNKAL